MVSVKFQVALFALFAHTCTAVNPIKVEGSNFVDSVTGNRFQIIGVAYQPGGQAAFSSTKDPLSDPEPCLRDAAILQRLGVNAIRVYSVDPDLNHDQCASIFNAVGIYMLLDVNSPLPMQSLNRLAPWETYNLGYMNRTFAVVEAFKDYPNTLAFFSGNEVMDDVPMAKINPPYIRAVTRDLKNYIAKHSSRPIPIGYSAADVRSILVDSWNYLSCTLTPDSPDTDPSRSDLFAINSYSWCGNATYQTSGYDILTSYFEKTSVPVFFSEYGCNQAPPRLFTEVQAIYSPPMSNVMSGGVVFEYTQEVNMYGLVTVHNDGSVKMLGDYDMLQKEISSLPNTVQSSKAQNTSNIPLTCNPSLISATGFTTNFTLPTVLPEIKALIDKGLTRPHHGNIVTIAQTKVSLVVQDSKGTTMQGLDIKISAQSKPSSVSTGAGSSGASSTTESAVSSSMSPTANASSGSSGKNGTNRMSPFRASLVALMGALAAMLWFL